MKLFSSMLIPRLQMLAILCLGVPTLTACAKPDGPNVPVSIHGVNYSEEAFSYILVDPANPENKGGGELIDAFSAGGTACCFQLPRKWRAGIKIEIRSTHWLPKLPDRTLPEVKRVDVVELPPYGLGKAGDLWVLRSSEGAMSIVSTDLQPDHQKWPGAVKGWPIPSLAFQREHHDLLISLVESDIRAAEEMQREYQKDPERSAAESWVLFQKYSHEESKGFAGPKDPKFINHLIQTTASNLKVDRLKMKSLKESRP
jgi:hypothetical protein